MKTHTRATVLGSSVIAVTASFACSRLPDKMRADSIAQGAEGRDSFIIFTPSLCDIAEDH